MYFNQLYLSWKLSLLCCILGFCQAYAQPSSAAFPDSIYTSITSGVSVYPTCDNEVSFEELQDSAFQGLFEEGIGYEVGCKHWLRLRLFIPKEASGYYVLKQPDWEGHTVYYFPKPDGSYSKAYSGLTVPPSQRSFNYPKYNKAKALLIGGDTLTIFLKVDFAANDSMKVPRLSIRPISMEYAISREASHGLLMMTIASILVLAMYNLAIFLYTQDRSYLYYSLSLFLVCPYMIVINREVWHWLTIDGLGAYAGRAGIFSGSLAGLFYLKFSMRYLGGREELPAMHRWVSLIVTVGALVFVATGASTLYYGYGNGRLLFLPILADGLFLLSIIAIMVYALRLVGKKHLPAKYYLLACLTFFPFLAIFFMQGESAEHYGYLGWIEGNAFTRASLKIGLVIQMLAFSLALASRINFLRRKVADQALQAEKAEKVKLLEIQQLIEQQNQELEGKVQSRTKQLQEAVEELQVSEDSLDRLNKTKDHFFALIAHDLRGPVASFQGLANMVQYQISKQQKDKAQEMMAQVDESASQLNALLDNLLQWAQTQIGGKSFQPTTIALYPMIQDIQQVYAGTAIAKGVKTEIDLQNESISVYADYSAMATVIRNLWSNALKFTEEGVISFRAREEGHETILIMSDTGVGIPAEKLERLFEIDPQKSSQGTRGEKGNGLGLLLCKEFIEQHGGTIRVESTLGKGTSIYLTLPTTA